MLQVQIIDKLNVFLKNYLNLPYGPLKSEDNISFVIEGTHEAINHKRSDSIQVKTVPWFKDFYLYMEVKYSRDYLHKMISLSVFQGESNDLRKNQLFRAEWDDFNKEDESRPQPHWHITRDKAIYDSYSDWIDHYNDKEKNGFEFFEEVQTEVFDTKKIHFAMSSNWQNQEHFVHKIDDPFKVVKWMEGLLEHIKYELQN